MPINPAAIPEECKSVPQWVSWAYEYRPKGHIAKPWTKVPKNPRTGANASPTDPQTWVAFDDALARLHQQPDLDGIGFVLTADDPYVVIDLDGCREAETGDIQPWAQAIIEHFRSYTEVSPSGAGIRILLKGQLPPHGRKKGAIEVYETARYVTITGCHVVDTPASIEPRQTELEIWHREVFGTPPAPGNPHRNGHEPSSPLTDDDILQKALGAKNSRRFAQLWAGAIHDDYRSQSEADLALCCLLSFYSQDAAQIDRLFRASGLMRPKWDEPHGEDTYGERTIQRALRKQTEHWTPQDTTPPVHLTDRGNALRLIKAHGRDLHYLYRWEKWLVWDGTRWVIDEGDGVEARAKQVITELYGEAKAIVDELAQRPPEPVDLSNAALKARQQKLDVATATLKWALKSESSERLSGMLRHARSEHRIPITPDDLDADPWVLNVANGTIDLRTCTLRPHRRDDFCTKRLTIPYDPQARCPHWEAFLWRIMGGPRPDEDGPEALLLERHERAARLVAFLQRAVGYSLTGVIREQVLFFM